MIFYFLLLSMNIFKACNATNIKIPKIKNNILNVPKVIAACGSESVVGPCIIEYNEPIIIPIIA